MFRVTARFLLVVMISSSMIDLHDLSKMAMLINHYREHVANGKTTFIDFIDMHYGEQAEKHDKEHGHKSLPFKSHESASTHHISAFFDLKIQPAIPTTTVIQNEILFQSHFTPGFSRSIFQPPKALI